MGLLSFLFKKDPEERASGAVDLSHPKDPGIVKVFGSPGQSTTGIKVTPKTSMEEEAVMTCCRIIGETLGIFPWQILQKNSLGVARKVRSHPLWELLTLRPNPDQSAVQLFEYIGFVTALRGRSYLAVNYNAGNPVESLVPLDPDRTRAFRGEDGHKAFAHRDTAGRLLIFNREEIVHFTDISLDGIEGMNRIEHARETIGASLALREYGNRHFTSDATPGGVLEIPGTLGGPENREEFRRKWQENYSGLQNKHKTAVLEGGASFKPISVSPADSEWLMARKYTRGQVAAMWRIPGYKVGDLERSIKANIEQQAIEFLTETMLPWVRRMEQEVNWSLLTRKERIEGMYAKLRFEGILRGDSKARAEFYKILFNMGAINQDEIRELEEMNPIPDGLGQKYYVPLNMVDVETANSMKDEIAKDSEE
jgi:HK97 family phage portal protein